MVVKPSGTNRSLTPARARARSPRQLDSLRNYRSIHPSLALFSRIESSNIDWVGYSAPPHPSGSSEASPQSAIPSQKRRDSRQREPFSHAISSSRHVKAVMKSSIMCYELQVIHYQVVSFVLRCLDAKPPFWREVA